MMRLATATIRHRWWSFVGTFTGTALAVALIAACTTLLFSALSAPAGADRFAAADAVISADRQVSVHTDGKTKSRELTGSPDLPEGLDQRLAAVAGVADVVPDVSFHAQPLDPAGRPVAGPPVMGHAWSSAVLTPFTLASGSAPEAGQVVLDTDLARRIGAQPGSAVRMTTSSRVVDGTVSGIAAAPAGTPFDSQAAVFFSDGDASALASSGASRALAVRFAPGAQASAVTDELRAAAGSGVRVLTGGDRVRADAPGVLVDYIGAVSVFATMTGITVFAALFVIAGTIAFTVRQRLRELAALRVLGATPRQVRRLLGWEAWTIGILAALFGTPLGLVAAGWLGHRFVASGSVPASFEVDSQPLPILIAAAAGTVVARLAAYLAGRRAARIVPGEAMRESVAGPGGGRWLRAVSGAVLAAGAVAVLTFTPMHGGIGVGMGFIACTLLISAATAWGPSLVRVLSALLGGLLPGATGQLAAANTRRFAQRAAGAAMPLALMLALNATMLLNSTLLTELTTRTVAQRAASVAQTLTAPGTPGLPVSAFDAVRDRGATDIDGTVPTEVVIEDGGDRPEHYPAMGLYRAGEGALDLGVTAGSLTDLADRTTAVSTDLAASRHWKVGDTVQGWLPDGSDVSLRVVALYSRSDGFGDLVLPGPLAVAHTTDPVLAAVHLASPVSPAALTRLQADLPVVAADRTASRVDAETGTQRAALELLIGISLSFTAVAVLNTFTLAAVSRRREYADLRLIGATARQVRAMAAREAVLTVAAGVLAGAAIAAVCVGVFSIAQDGHWRIVVDPEWYAALLAGTAVLGLAAAALPTRLVLRTIRSVTGAAR